MGTLKTELDKQKQQTKHFDFKPTCDMNLNLRDSINASVTSTAWLAKTSDYFKDPEEKS